MQPKAACIAVEDRGRCKDHNVQLTIRHHQGKRLRIPRLINDKYLISLASEAEFRGNMDMGLRSTNFDMLRWPTGECGLSPPEAHRLTGSMIEHKIVTYNGSIATLMPKEYLPERCHQFGEGSLR